jgi:hypothetical protein
VLYVGYRHHLEVNYLGLANRRTMVYAREEF